METERTKTLALLTAIIHAGKYFTKQLGQQGSFSIEDSQKIAENIYAGAEKFDREAEEHAVAAREAEERRRTLRSHSL